jgi:outer membrane receptor for ferrienterochelin and colicins
VEAWGLTALVLSLAAGVGASVEPPEPEPPELPEQAIVVTGTRTPRRLADDPIGTEVIGQRELTARNVRDASRALEAEPGILSERSFRGSSFQLRGLDAKYVRILVDGQPVMGQVNDVIDLRRYAVEAVDRIEIVRGATSALYGSDALAGVVNLVSRRPRRPLEIGGFAQYGMLNQSMLGATAGVRRGDSAGTLSVNWFGNNSYDLTPGDENLSTNGDARRAFTATARGFHTASEKLELMGFVRGGFFDSRGVDLQPPRALFNRRVGEAEGAAGGQATWTPDARTRVTTFLQGNVFARDFSREQRQADRRERMESTESLVRGEVQADRTYAERKLVVTTGLGGQHAAFRSPRIEGGQASLRTGWLFAQAELGLGEHLDLVAGGRFDADEQFGRQLSPRLAARLKLSSLAEGLSLRAAYGEGFRAPSFGERFLAFYNQVANYVVYGNEALRPEVSRSGQAGLEWAPRVWRLPGGLSPSLRVTGFHTTLDNLIQALELRSGTLDREFRYENYESARLAGVESSLRLTAGAWLVADLGYAWLDTVATIVREDQSQVTRALPGRAGRHLTGSLLYVHEETGTEVTVRAQGLFLRTALADDTTLAPILLADVRLARRLWRATQGRSEVQLYLHVDNLANVTEPEFISLPGTLVALGVNARY